MSSEQDKMPLTVFIFKTTTTSSELPIKKGSSIQTASSLFCKKSVIGFCHLLLLETCSFKHFLIRILTRLTGTTPC